MFDALIKHPTKGDWTSNALDLVEKFEFNLTLNEMQAMKASYF